jgi:Xaa-Pro aminopeptidase
MFTHTPAGRRVAGKPAKALPMREQAKVVNRLLKIRLEKLLPELMAETGFDMWLILCNEDNHDPIFNTLIPFDTWAPITQMIAFFRKADGTVERMNISMTGLQGLYQDQWKLESPEDQWATLKRIIEERQPKNIGINESETIWGADGLTATFKRKLVECLGPELSQRLVSAEPLCIRWLETRVPEELELYARTVALGHDIIAECFSCAVITPGVTTCEDLRWEFWQRTVDRGLNYSFIPFFGFQRSDETKKQFDPADGIIRPGDLLHCDVGVIYMRLYSDLQELAYVLRPGESDAPEGMKAMLKMGNRLQDILTSNMKIGRTGNEILNAALAQANQEGLSNPKIYTHSLGHLLHEPGPLIGLPWEQKDTGARGEVKLSYNTTFSIELGVRGPLAEWGGQSVGYSIEQDAVITPDGAYFFDGRQTALHLVG